MNSAQSRAVWKYVLTSPVKRFDMPAGAEILTVETQGSQPTLWALVDPKAEQEQRMFVAIGTGMDFDYDPGTEYVGTAHNVEGAGLVFHIFEVRRD